MKRNWDTIRDILIETEECSGLQYKEYETDSSQEKAYHAALLLDNGYIRGNKREPIGKLISVTAMSLTWAGHDLLDTIRSKPVWERIKNTAGEKGIELTFDAIKALAAIALQAVIGK